MEMYWNEEPKVATNVFELGLKLFSKETDYVLRYLDFLLTQNNANSECDSVTCRSAQRAELNRGLRV